MRAVAASYRAGEDGARTYRSLMSIGCARRHRIAEYSVRAAQTAVYQLFGVDRKIPVITPHDKSLRVQPEALQEAFK